MRKEGVAAGVKRNEYLQGIINYLLSLIVGPVQFLMTGTRSQGDSGAQTASVIATGSEVFGRSVGGIVVSVELRNGAVWLCFGKSYMRLILAGKVLQDWLLRVVL